MAAKKSEANQALGRAIRAVRLERGLGQEALAALAGLDRSYFGAIERGEYNVSVDTVAKVAVGLGATLGELFAQAGL
ncbi:MAG TPA: helix-turn-helix transcriptional regulator [Solirubrobacteraceae bacterium]|nr:helix-turn-helix transcriptional regulator [Solirubrobacteraceae bacterium]